MIGPKSILLTASAAAALIITAGVWLTLGPSVSAQDEAITIDNLTLGAGGQGKVTLDAENFDTVSLGAWSVDVLYDSSIVSPLSCVSHESGFCNAAFDDGVVRSTGASSAGLTGDTQLASITFECVGTGTSNLLLELDEVFDDTEGDPQPIDAAAENGAVTCSAPPTVTSTPTVTPTATPDVLLGDVSCNGTVNSIDAALILQFDAELLSVLPCPENADVNDDGNINSVDALLILQFDAGLIDEF